MNLQDLLYKLTHQFPGVVSTLEHRLGYAERTLQNKINPHTPANLFVQEIEPIADLVGCNRDLARHFAQKDGGVVFYPPTAAIGDMELLDSFMGVIKELGEFSAEFQTDFADGVITEGEYARLVKESDEVISTMLELRSRISRMVKRLGHE